MENEGRAIGILPWHGNARAKSSRGNAGNGLSREFVPRILGKRATRALRIGRAISPFGECAQFWRGGDANNRPSHLRELK